jgi:hypothetical protein
MSRKRLTVPQPCDELKRALTTAPKLSEQWPFRILSVSEYYSIFALNPIQRPFDKCATNQLVFGFLKRLSACQFLAGMAWQFVTSEALAEVVDSFHEAV